MPDPITLSLIVGAALGGVVEALASKTAEKTPDLARRAQKLVTLKQDLPLSQYDATVAPRSMMRAWTSSPKSRPARPNSTRRRSTT